MSKTTEDDTRARFIDPALLNAGWNNMTQVNRQYHFTAGRIMVSGKLHTRAKSKYADYLLSYQPNMPLAIIEAKHIGKSLGTGMQQALDYAEILDVPFVFSTNGEGFLFHDKTGMSERTETEIGLDSFPSPDELWKHYKAYKGIDTPEQANVIEQPYFSDGSGRKPRFYQQIAINRTVEAVSKGQNRILLVMATGTGKTYTAFQIIHRLWKSGAKKRVLFLADRTALIDQTLIGDFRHFNQAMTVVRHKKIDTAYSIYLALYQGLSDSRSEDAYKQFSRDFFDLIVVDECHRGSAKEDSKWREILEYFSSATHLGLTATPKETKEVSNIDYFGEPIYTYSLKEGINDGFLAPYKVLKVTLDIDVEGWRPPTGFKDKDGQIVEDRIYNRTDFDRKIVVDERRKLVARKVSEFLKGNDPYAKTIVFCTDIEHAEGMRSALVNENPDLVQENRKYVMQITGDNEEGKRELDSFTNPQSLYPVIATTSKLMTTGVDAQTCKLIVLDSNIGSMTEFKQIIGRGTRVNEDYGKTYFTIMDFRNVTSLFADPDFDGDPVMVKEVNQDDTMDNVEDEVPNDSVDPSAEDHVDFPLPPNPDPKTERQKKVRVNGVDVTILNERVQFMNAEGQLVTEDLRDYTRKNVSKSYQNYEAFLRRWNESEKKRVLIEELESEGVLFEALEQEVGGDYDAFDLICHVAFDAKPLTRKERANNVTKRDYFAQYGETARAVLESILIKYTEDGIREIENREVLRLNPISSLGTPFELINAFGGQKGFDQAIRELEQELYKTA